MSDTPNSKKLDEAQMDQLLGAFYKSEMPAALDNLPSSWPALIQQSASKAAPPTVIVASQTAIARRESTSAGRAIAVIASLAVCLMLVVLSNFSGVSDPADNTIQVSGEGGPHESVVVDPDVKTTMDEVDGFDLESSDKKSGPVTEPVTEPKTETER